MNVVTIGDNCIDAYINLGEFHPGGNPVNVSVYMKRIGIDSAYIGVLGNDENGKIIRNSLIDKGVNIEHLKVREGKTAVSIVNLVNGDRVFGDYDEGVLKDFKLTDEDIEFALSSNLIHTGLWGKIENDLHKLYNKGPLISFDFADKLNNEMVYKALPFVDYCFFSYDKEDDYIKEYLIKAQKRGPKAAIATLGENGSIAWDGYRFTHAGIVEVEAVDTMGAGDSYIAGFMKGVLEGKSVLASMQLGAKTAAETLKYYGAW